MPMPDGKPAFLVRVVSNYNGNSQLLQWAKRPDQPLVENGMRDPVFERMRFFGTFACYPVHDGGELLPAIVPAPPPTARVPWPFPVSAHQEKP